MKINQKSYAQALAGMLLLIGTAFTSAAIAQLKTDDPLMKINRETPVRINDLIHTRLDVRFDYKKRYLYGKEWVTIKPHFYPTDTLRLDAKGMDIQTVALVKNGKNIPLKYTYDQLSLAINLDKEYQHTENYTVFIAYTAKPDEPKHGKYNPAPDAKGLYFINQDSTVKDKPVQIWTDGEPENSSAWFPTIDKPGQKTTDEISMTVPAKYVTLSNGRLASQKNNTDGTRTDTWKMELPHSPYLFMMAVGDFKIYHDKWRDKEVNYYLEPLYAPYAREIFGDTPQMMDFFSKTLGIDYPWNKYSQIVVRDYISGAMENTTATLHGTYIQGTSRELADRYYDAGRSTIAHELFHQWFGDYVTAKNWGNITVGESFANFGEVLWAEHKYGQDVADDHNNADLELYLENTEYADKDLVRFHYRKTEDVFDPVSYQKGGRIVNMLRHYLGGPAFYKGLNIYLKTNAFKTAEAQQLRLAMEEASGKDLNWFFDQWYYGAGHPLLDISYKWEEKTHTQTIYLKQTQPGKAFILPMFVDIYAGGKKERHKIRMNNQSDTLSYQLAEKPQLVNVDAEKSILSQKTDHKSIAEFLFQYQNAPLYMDRYEAINAALALQKDATAQKTLILALQDKYYGLRLKALKSIDPANSNLNEQALPIILKLAKSDENNLVKAAAIQVIGASKIAPQQSELFKAELKNQSYAIMGASLSALADIDHAEGVKMAKTYEKGSTDRLVSAIIGVYGKYGQDTEWPYVYKNFLEANSRSKILVMKDFTGMLERLKNPEYTQQGVTVIKDFGIRLKEYGFGAKAIEDLNRIKEARKQMGDDASVQFINRAIEEINTAK
ncbi:aminopeptidase N [Pedobacter cryoconitis]|uniref:Aminopeptidase N n=1 Tax=Pedobacter cryoconitis TaxID=188932 RepID=A0A7W8ZMV7_9SPHI|nr:M1 family metallopeptidase [Pedobacter cryoconitis]MBB5636830.1 aminopeptidase N [Pedobacter cryoconitis]